MKKLQLSVILLFMFMSFNNFVYASQNNSDCIQIAANTNLPPHAIPAPKTPAAHIPPHGISAPQTFGSNTTNTTVPENNIYQVSDNIENTNQPTAANESRNEQLKKERKELYSEAVNVMLKKGVEYGKQHIKL